MGRPVGSTKKVSKPAEAVEVIETKIEEAVVGHVETVATHVAPLVPPAPKKPFQVDRNQMVPVRSICYGQLQYVSPRTGLTTYWGNYGSVEWMEFGELITMKSSMAKFFNKPWIIVEDEDVANYLGLAEKYKTMINVEQLDDFFRKPIVEIKALLMSAPIGIRETIMLKSRDMIRDELLTDIRVIKTLDEVLKVNLMEILN